MPAPLSHPVVVITGASSGIGRATARRFAADGALLVLAARRAEALAATAEECRALGGDAIAVVTDVRQVADVEALAEAALVRWNRIDLWVNNAAVSAFGRMEDMPPEVFEQVVSTNLMGCVNGSRAAVRWFRRQNAGHLVNVASVVGCVGQPFASPYVSSKWAIRGLSECLRMELLDCPTIQVSTVLPAAIDTPIFRKAANYTGRRVRAMSPVYPPEQVADAIYRLLRHPRREVVVGNAGRLMTLLARLAPGAAERLMARMVAREHLDRQRRTAPSTGNVLAPSGPGVGRVRDGWLARTGRPTEASQPAVLGAVAAATLLVAAVAYWRRRG